MKPVNRIALILLVIFLMPALFFSAYELASLNQDEEQINEIYNNQLEAILFSANQYSDDILDAWIAKIELSYDLKEDDSIKELNNLLIFNSSIEALFSYDTTDQSFTMLHKFGKYGEDTEKEVKSNLAKADTLLFNLIKYAKSGYQKVEAVKLTNDDMIGLLFHPKNGERESEIKGLLVDPEVFIADVIGPRLQNIAKDRFTLMATQEGKSEVIYCTVDSLNKDSLTPILTKELWVLPGYQLGISTKGTSIQSIIKERTNTNLILIIVLDVFLILGVVLVFRNVKKEVQLAQNKSEFISNVSHEIRTPLALISMFAETLDMGRVPTEEKKKEYYSILTKESQRLTSIVNKILSFSQMDAGKKQLHLSELKLGAVVEEVLTTYEYHLKNEGFEVSTNFDDVLIKGDKDLIIEMIINLIDNAIKYSEKTKKLDISISNQNHKAVLTVKDHGVGISKSDQTYIFDKFFRVSTGDLAKKQGTGLGLALVKQIVDAHNASIELKSEIGKGTSFIVYFPLIEKSNG